MEDVRKHPWIFLRKEKDGTRRYYLRARVPADLVETLRKKEIKISLGTVDPREARRKIDVEAMKVREIFEKARRRRDTRTLSDLTKAEIERLALVWFHDTEPASIRQDDLYTLPDDARVQLEQDLSHNLRVLTSGDETSGYLNEVHAVADRILMNAGFRERRVTSDPKYGRSIRTEADVDKTSPQYQELCSFVHRALLERNKLTESRLRGERHGMVYDPLFAGIGSVSPGPQVTTASISLSKLVDDYLHEPDQMEITDKTREGRRVMFGVLMDVLGRDIQITEITRTDMRKVRDILLKLPPNVSKRFPGLSAEEAAEQAERRGLAPLSATSAKSYLSNFSALFRYAEREHGLSANPAEGLRVTGKRTRTRKPVQPYTTEELSKIFDAPLYRGCQDDERGYAKRGPNVPRRGRFWVPLIALFSGMRESEICDLKVTDIVERNGIDVIVVREGKTDAANRIIPVHPELKKIGFLRYVQAIRDAGHALLFPDLPVGRGRSRGQLFSKWFSRFAARAKVKTDKSKNFHSFRHTFRDALGEADVSRDAVRQLGAWAGVDTADKNYGAGLRASTLAREIEKVGYPGLDLSHLYLEGSKPPPKTNDDGDGAVP